MWSELLHTKHFCELAKFTLVHGPSSLLITEGLPKGSGKKHVVVKHLAVAMHACSNGCPH
jgi:hypothetical protein